MALNHTTMHGTAHRDTATYCITLHWTAQSISELLYTAQLYTAPHCISSQNLPARLSRTDWGQLAPSEASGGQTTVHCRASDWISAFGRVDFTDHLVLESQLYCFINFSRCYNIQWIWNLWKWHIQQDTSLLAYAVLYRLQYTPYTMHTK